ncbi:MAG TPA: 3-oxoacyl-[acyl-carrier-protein] reductase [Anaerolineae bacterium]|nr:3-oxoacyl-[acyl-carrier-protein] reductase [Anaerolineae bacterium]
MLLTDKVAVVTGSSRGIGRAIAIDFAANGAKVIINYNSNADAAAEVVAEIKAAGGEATAVGADISDFTAAQMLMDTAIETYGQVDILVNNAGTTRDKLIMSMKEDDWDTVLNVNLKSAFNCCRAILRPMLKRRQGGRIINISSVIGIMGQGGQSNYAASKAGLIGLTKSLAKEVASRQVTVNAIAPGFFPTDLTNKLDDKMKEQILGAIPLGRFGDLPEVAHLATFLASERAAYITGEIIKVDGGVAI